MSATPTADLVRDARRLRVPLSDRGARRLRARLGDDLALQRVRDVAALRALADALGATLTVLEARRLLDTAGSYQAAVDRFVDELTERRGRAFSRAWARFERELWAHDAVARHASVRGDHAAGALGWQVEMLLAAARDAGLTDREARGRGVPGSRKHQEKLAGVIAGFRARIETAVSREMDRRYPDRREARWQVLDADEQTAHEQIVGDQIRADRAARALALERMPSLRQQIDHLADSPRMRQQVEAVLADLRRRLELKVSGGGWAPDVERYRREVIDRAAHAARRTR